MKKDRAEPLTGTKLGAIDLMYFPPASSSHLNELPCHEAIEPCVRMLHEVGIDKVFVTQCKRWSCDRRWMCNDTQLDEILRYTRPHPEVFIGIAGYNPFDIGPSVHEAEYGIRDHGFRGVYVHPGSFGLMLSDRRVYPLFVKTLDWNVPVIADIKPLAKGDPNVSVEEMEQVAGDFPELRIVARCNWTGEEIARLADNCPNLYFCFGNSSLLNHQILEFVNSEAGQGRCLWGSDGVPWKTALPQFRGLQVIAPDKLLHSNAARVFALHRKPRKHILPFRSPTFKMLRFAAE